MFFITQHEEKSRSFLASIEKILVKRQKHVLYWNSTLLAIQHCIHFFPTLLGHLLHAQSHYLTARSRIHSQFYHCFTHITFLGGFLNYCKCGCIKCPLMSLNIAKACCFSGVLCSILVTRDCNTGSVDLPA